MEALAQSLSSSLSLRPSKHACFLASSRSSAPHVPAKPVASASHLRSAASLCARPLPLHPGLAKKLPASCVPHPRPACPGSARADATTDAAAALLLEEDGVPLGGKYPPFAAFRIHGTGRRKTAVARVGLIEGDGTIIVNDLSLNDYFQDQALLIQAVKLPLSSLGYLSKFDVVVKAHGGGLSAQAQAMMLGIARALVKVNEANKPPLKAQGMLTRDSRAVERKKYGLKKARKAPQFSKR